MHAAAPTEKEPWLLHMVDWSRDTDVDSEMQVLRDGMLRSAADRNQRSLVRTGVDPAKDNAVGISSKRALFLRLGTPRDVANLWHGVVLALDARALLQYRFQLNVGWGARRGAEGCAQFDGREMTDPALFAALKELNRARNLEFQLNRAPAKEGRRAALFEASNEIMAFRPVPLRAHLRAVFVPAKPSGAAADRPPPGRQGISQARVQKIRDIVAQLYPDARVIEYIPATI